MICNYFSTSRLNRILIRVSWQYLNGCGQEGGGGGGGSLGGGGGGACRIENKTIML